MFANGFTAELLLVELVRAGVATAPSVTIARRVACVSHLVDLYARPDHA